MVDQIKTKADRSRLEQRREPYWDRIKKGCYVGYRVSVKSGDGTWIARWRNPDGKQQFNALGNQDSYDKAVAAALSWFDHCVKTDGSPFMTVWEVCLHYIESLESEGRETTATDVSYRFKRNIQSHEIASISMETLRPRHITTWRNGLEMAPSSVNRNLASLLAAFNLAYKQNLVADNSPWRGIKKLAAPANPRDRWLSIDERKRLLDACQPDLRSFVLGLILTGARPGELASVKVSDVNLSERLITMNGKVGRRKVSVSSEMLELCKSQAKGKAGSVFLFRRDDGKKWTRHNWDTPFEEAVEKSGLGKDVVLYVLRHSAISEMVKSGMSVFAVAKYCGTSSEQIDKHYGHLCPKGVSAELDTIKLV